MMQSTRHPAPFALQKTPTTQRKPRGRRTWSLSKEWSRWLPCHGRRPTKQEASGMVMTALSKPGQAETGACESHISTQHSRTNKAEAFSCVGTCPCPSLVVVEYEVKLVTGLKRENVPLLASTQRPRAAVQRLSTLHTVCAHCVRARVKCRHLGRPYFTPVVGFRGGKTIIARECRAGTRQQQPFDLPTPGHTPAASGQIDF